ncbi:MAG: hypothetical protein QM817_15875 [Archangium sp.]
MNRLLAVSVLSLTACGPRINYVLMQSSLNDPATDDRPEVTSTAEAQNVLPRVRRVAVRAPDACASQSAAETTGAANNRGSIVQTDCGVEMAELERALTRAGYQVFSWKQIQAMARTTPAEAAARQLGAEVLFQVNSLERVSYVPSRNARWDRGFFASDADAIAGEPFALKQTDLQRLEPLFAQYERQAMQRLGAMLDLNAVSTETGQTLWFYRRVRFEQPGSPRTQVLLKKGKGGWGPAPVAQAAPPPYATATQSQPVGYGMQRMDSAYFELMRSVVAEFTGHFAAGGGASQAKLPPAGPPPMPPPAL